TATAVSDRACATRIHRLRRRHGIGFAADASKGGLALVRAADYNGTVYDALTSRYTFACPTRGESQVNLSAFRELERLPGAAHPAVYRVRFACPCGEDHLGFVSHAELDWEPLGL